MLQNEELEQQRSTLATNISSLYKTAKLELQRKDAEIKELRERWAFFLPGRLARALDRLDAIAVGAVCTCWRAGVVGHHMT